MLPLGQSLVVIGALISFSSASFAESSQWNTKSIPMELPCVQKIPDFTFDLSRDYRSENAFMLLWASALAESPDRQFIQAGLKAWGFTSSTLIGKPATGAYAYLAEAPDFHLLSFRGTNSWQEVLLDAMFLPHSFAKIGVAGSGHQGMMAQFRYLLRQTEPVLNKIDPDRSKPLLITGHSLGGAVALLHALHFNKTGWDLIGVYTSAQPRLGDATFYQEVATSLQGRYFRMEAEQDFTPRIPPSIESAASFARVIPDQLKKLQTGLLGFVEQMNYSIANGVRLRIGADLQLEYENTAANDIGYWDQLRGTINDAKSFPEVVNSLRGRFDIHPPQRYMCAFLKAYHD